MVRAIGDEDWVIRRHIVDVESRDEPVQIGFAVIVLVARDPLALRLLRRRIFNGLFDGSERGEPKIEREVCFAAGRGHMRVRINQAWKDSLAWERQRLRAGPRERPDVARGSDGDEPAILDRHGLRSWTRIVHRDDVGVYNHEIE